MDGKYYIPEIGTTWKELEWPEPRVNVGGLINEALFEKCSVSPNFTTILKKLLDQSNDKPAAGDGTDQAAQTEAEKNDEDNKPAIVVDLPVKSLAPQLVNSPNDLHSILQKSPFFDPRFPFQKVSSLSQEQQKYLLSEYISYSRTRDISAKQPVHLQKLEELMKCVSEEQNEFMAYLHQHAVHCHQDFNIIPPHIQKNFQSWREKEASQIVHKYPQFYMLHQTVSLSVGAVYPTDPVLLFLQTLLEQDTTNIPTVKIPQDFTPRSLSVIENSSGNTDPVTNINQAVSEDPIACDFAVKYKAHIVITSLAIDALIQNHPPAFAQDWELPFTVKTVECTDQPGPAQKTVFIDDPFAPSSVSPEDACVKYYDAALRKLLSDNQSEEEKTPITPQLSAENNQPEQISEGIYKGNSSIGEAEPALSLAGVVGSSHTQVVNGNTGPVGKQSTLETENSMRASVNDELVKTTQLSADMPPGNLSLGANQEVIINSRKRTLSNMDEIQQSPITDDQCELQNKKKKINISGDLTGSSEETQEIKDSRQPCNEHITSNWTDGDVSTPKTRLKTDFTYSLWKFGSLIVLIRTNVDGRGEFGDKETNVLIRSKLEYQPLFGHGLLHVNEASRLWMQLYTRPETSVILGRVNCMTSQIMRIDHLSISDVINSSWSFSPSQSMKHLSNVLKSVHSFGTGRYLLAHTAKSIHACVYSAISPMKTKPRVAFDLYESQSGPSVFSLYDPSHIPWVLLDVNSFLPTHINNIQIPGTFPPVGKEVLSKLKPKEESVGQAKKKKKKKKKSKQQKSVVNVNMNMTAHSKQGKAQVKNDVQPAVTNTLQSSQRSINNSTDFPGCHNEKQHITGRVLKRHAKWISHHACLDDVIHEVDKGHNLKETREQPVSYDDVEF